MSNLITPHYINRKDQIGEIEKLLNNIRLGQTVFASILEWHGIPGIGKTTLVQEAIEFLCQKGEIPFTCINFDSRENSNAKNYPAAPILILKDIVEGMIDVQGQADFEETLEKYRQATDGDLRAERKAKVIDKFLLHIHKLLKDGPVVLAFDTTDKAEPDVTAWLEEKIISPLGLTGKCIIVWAGRFPQRWKRFEVRRRVVSNKLEPFSQEVTAEQVGTLEDEIGIHCLTFGHPMSNYRLQKTITHFRKEKRTFEKKDLINVVNEVIDDYVMREVSPELRAACRALAVVRQFDVIMLRRILSKFVDYFRGQEAFLKVIGDLTGTSLVEWDTVRKGYALDETVRRILALHLLLNQPDRYMDINETAANTYEDWIEQVRENRSVYVLERLYHQASIASSRGETQDHIEGKLQRKLQGYLEKYYQKGQDFALSSATQLYEELCQDSELEEIVGEPGFACLKETVNSHRLTLEKNK